MLKATLKAYHKKMYRPWFHVRPEETKKKKKKKTYVYSKGLEEIDR